MNLLTLFDTYQYVEQSMKSIELTRKYHNIGIAVDKDLKALKWQRLNSMKFKLSHNIRVKLSDENHIKYNVCIYCGMPDGKFHNCVVDYKEHRKLLRQLTGKGLL